MNRSSTVVSPQSVGRQTDLQSLSEWLDGELPPDESRPVIDRMLCSPDLQQSWQRWAYAGDALRSEETAVCHSQSLCDRICAAIDEQPAIVAPRALLPFAGPVSRRMQMAGTALAVAAAAAVVMIVAIPQWRIDQGGGSDTGQITLSGQSQDVRLAAGVPARPQPIDPALERYLVAHREFAGGAIVPAAHVYASLDEGAGR